MKTTLTTLIAAACSMALATSCTLQSPSTIHQSPVTLIDRLSGTETDLTAAAYTFRADAGTQNSRFVIRMGDATGIADSRSPLDAPRYYDLQGRRVSQHRQGVYIKDHKTVIIK